MLYLSNFFNSINEMLFYEIFHFPLLILFLIITALFISFKLRFPAERLLRHGLQIAIKNKYSKHNLGTITPKQALFTSLTGTLGMGSIAGVAIAIRLGGPGSILWMILSVFFTTNIIFAETTLSHKYRKLKEGSQIDVGPFSYLRKGLKDVGYAKFGLFLSTFYAILLIFEAFGMVIFQVNQGVNILINYDIFTNCKVLFCSLFTVIVIYALFKDSKGISKLIDKILPFLTLIYTISILTIIHVNYKNIPNTISIIIKDAFSLKAGIGGLIGSMCVGIKRGTFSNEAGLGSSSIPHALSKLDESVAEASIASIAPLTNTLFFCFLSGFIIVLTDSYNLQSDGVLMTKNAFLTVANWFPIFLTISVVMFVIGNITTYSFYGKTYFTILTRHNKYAPFFNIAFALAIFGSAFIKLDLVVLISDTLVLCLIIPNLIGILLMSNLLKKEIDEYTKKIKN